MTLGVPLLTRRATLLAKVETTYGVDPVPTSLLDAVLVEDPDYSVDVNILERNFVRDDLSPLAIQTGRKIASMTFQTELRGNGLQQDGATPPIIGALLRGSGYAETLLTGAGTVGAVKNVAGNTVNPSAWASGGVSGLKDEVDYVMTVIVAGVSATAELRVTANNPAYDAAIGYDETLAATTDSTLGTITPSGINTKVQEFLLAGTWAAADVINFTVMGQKGSIITADGVIANIIAQLETAINLLPSGVDTDIVAVEDTIDTVDITFANELDGEGAITSGVTAVTLGNSGATVTPTWAGSLTLGDSWTVRVTPVGIRYDPVSTLFESVTLYLYLDGVFHKLRGAYGTFEITAPAGEYSKISWTFTGIYEEPTDVAIPTDTVFETTLPAMVELAKLRLDDIAGVDGGQDGGEIIVASFSYNQNNNVVPRPDVSSSDGFIGIRITGRSPEGGFDPESTLITDENFWKKLTDAKEMPFSMRVGIVAGNIIWIKAPKIQYTGLSYQSRDDIRVYDAGLRFAREDGDDEIRFIFT